MKISYTDFLEHGCALSHCGQNTKVNNASKAPTSQTRSDVAERSFIFFIENSDETCEWNKGFDGIWKFGGQYINCLKIISYHIWIHISYPLLPLEVLYSWSCFLARLGTVKDRLSRVKVLTSWTWSKNQKLLSCKLHSSHSKINLQSAEKRKTRGCMKDLWRCVNMRAFQAFASTATYLLKSCLQFFRLLGHTLVWIVHLCPGLVIGVDVLSWIKLSNWIWDISLPMIWSEKGKMTLNASCISSSIQQLWLLKQWICQDVYI